MLEGALTGKVAVVTGAAGGIGGAVATAFADAGADVVGLDREQADLSRRRTRSSRSSPASSASTSSSTAAGISGRRLGDGPVDECTEDAWDTVLDTNLKSVFLCCKHAVPLLRAAGGGAIVNVSSVLRSRRRRRRLRDACLRGEQGGDRRPLARDGRALRAAKGIRCNVVAPGLIATPMSERAQSDRRILRAPARAAAAHRRLRHAGGRRRRGALPRDRAVRHRRGAHGRRGLDGPSEPPPRPRPRRDVDQVGRPGGRRGSQRAVEEDPRGGRPGGRDRAAESAAGRERSARSTRSGSACPVSSTAPPVSSRS